MPFCKICNKPTSCTYKSGWRNTACCIDHYQEWLRQESGGELKMAYKLRACMNDIVYDVIDYSITKNDIELITTASNKVINLSDTEYLIVLSEEKKNVLMVFEDDGNYIVIKKSEYVNVIRYNTDIDVDNENKIDDSLKKIKLPKKQKNNLGS